MQYQQAWLALEPINARPLSAAIVRAQCGLDGESSPEDRVLSRVSPETAESYHAYRGTRRWRLKPSSLWEAAAFCAVAGVADAWSTVQHTAKLALSSPTCSELLPRLVWGPGLIFSA